MPFLFSVHGIDRISLHTHIITPPQQSALNKTMVAATTVKIDSLRPFFRYASTSMPQPLPPPLTSSPTLPPSLPSGPRELCLDVFAALEYSSVSRTLLDSESQTQEREELSLDPPQLLYLLQDLSAKVTHTLSAFRGAKAKVVILSIYSVFGASNNSYRNLVETANSHILRFQFHGTFQ